MIYDLDLAKFSEVNQYNFPYSFMSKEVVQLPHELEFLANFSRIDDNLDFPVAGGIPVMSNRMVKTIKSCGSFKSKEYSITLTDDTILMEHYSKKERPKDQVRKGYSIFQTLEIFDGFDYDLSDYDPMRSYHRFPVMVHRLVLKQPQTGFPPVFRINEKRSMLLVTHTVMESLINSEVTGCVFKEIATNLSNAS